MKKIVSISLSALFFVALASPSSDACTASTTIDGITFSCSGTNKCSAKEGKWIKCDGNKIRVAVR